MAIITLERPVPTDWGVKPAKISNSGIGNYDRVFLSGFGTGKVIENNSTTDRYDRNHRNGKIMKTISGKVVSRPRLGSSLNYSKNSDPEYFLDAQQMFSIQFNKIDDIQSYACGGDSGAGIFNNRGELVGIHSSIPDKVFYTIEEDGRRKPNRVLDCEEGYGYAVEVKNYKDWIISGFDSRPAYPFGFDRVPHPKDIIEGSRDSRFVSELVSISNPFFRTITELYIASEFAPHFGFNLALTFDYSYARHFRVTERSCRVHVKYKTPNSEDYKYVKLNICGRSPLLIR